MDSRQLAIAAALLLAVAVPTAAVTVAGSDDSVDAGAATVTLAPHDGPNGEYATVTHGEIEIDFERLNDEAKTTTHDVFTITATGQASTLVWVTVEGEGVDVYRGDDPDAAIDSRDDAVRLSPGESTSVGFVVDTNQSVPDPGAVTVHVRKVEKPETGPSQTPDGGDGDGDAEFVVTDLTAPDETLVGESQQVVATVENVGDADGSYVARLVVDGTVVDRRTVTIPAGETRTVAFERTFDRPGEYEVAVGEERRTVTVRRPTAPSASFEMSETRIADDEIQAGDTAEISVTVENVGNASGETTVELVVGGTVVDAETVSLAPGESRTVTFQRAFQQPGVYQIGISGVEAGEVTVLAGAEADGRRLSSSLQTAAAGPVLVLLLLLLVWRYGRRSIG